MENATQNKLHGLVLELLRVGMSPSVVIEMLSIESKKLMDSYEYINAIEDSHRM